MEAFQSHGYLSLVLSFICGTIQIIILISFIKSTRKKLPNASTIVAYLCILLYILYSLSIFTESVYILSVSTLNFNPNICIIGYLTPILTNKSGEVLLYIFYLLRLYKMFTGTTFTYNKCKLSLFAILMIISLYSIDIIFTTLTFNEATDTQYVTDTKGCDHLSRIYSKESSTKALIYFIATLLTETTAAVIILRLYLRKLVLLSLAYDQYEFESKEHKQKNERFLELMVKTSNLVVIVVVSSYASIIFMALQFGIFIVLIDHTIIALCIYLSYAVNQSLYDKLCCSTKCYRFCTILCYCCCAPRNIKDESLEVAIQENCKRHRFNSISISISYRPSISMSHTSQPSQSGTASASKRVSKMEKDIKNTQKQLNAPSNAAQTDRAQSPSIDIDDVDILDGANELRDSTTVVKNSSKMMIPVPSVSAGTAPSTPEMNSNPSAEQMLDTVIEHQNKTDSVELSEILDVEAILQDVRSTRL